MSESHSDRDNPLLRPIRFVKGVGPKIAEILASRGMHTAGDLLYHIPSRYVDRTQVVTMEEMKDGTDISVAGEIVGTGVGFAGRGRRRFEVVLSDGTAVLRLKWFRFQQKYFQAVYTKGTYLLVSGRVTRFRGEMQMVHPSVEILAGEGALSAEAPGIIPIYPTIQKLGQKYLNKIIQYALELCLPALEDTLPLDFCEQHNLIPLKEALTLLHRPSADTDLFLLTQGKSAAHRRLIFEELFFLELGLALKRQQTVREPGLALSVPQGFRSQLLKDLPFELTQAQQRVLGDVFYDMESGHPINRVIQGDVG